MSAKMNEGLAAIVEEARVSADFREWMVSPEVLLLDPVSFGLAAPKEEDIQARITEVAKAAG